MGKIHIKGGSPLKLRFEDADGNILKGLKLEGKGPWYYVDNDGDRIQANRRPKGNCFKVDQDDRDRMDIQYDSEEP